MRLGCHNIEAEVTDEHVAFTGGQQTKAFTLMTSLGVVPKNRSCDVINGLQPGCAMKQIVKFGTRALIY